MKALIAMLLVLSATACGAAEAMPVTYEAAGRTFEGYYVSPAPDAPLVLLIHDWDGLTDYEVQRAEMLGELGYAVFAADLFGAGVRPESLEERRRLTGELYQNRDEMRTLLRASLRTARERSEEDVPVVVMGYCFGGTAVLELARSGADVEGYVTFHGGLDIPEGQDYSQAKGEYLILHGTADQSISMDDFAGLAVALEEAGLPHEMITYGGAPHAFTVFGSDRYHEEADRRSWERFTAFLGNVLR